MIFVLQEVLQGLLPEPYDAASNERTWIEYVDRSVIPDVNVVRRGSGKSSRRDANGSSAAVAETGTGVIIHVPAIEGRESYLEIHVNKGGKLRLVTHIEVLSPSNKRRPHAARKAYRKKQRECLEANVHLVEIDLLREGEHTTAIDRGRLHERIAEYDYHVCIRHFHLPDQFLIFPIRMEEHLPQIPIPLLPEDGSVTIDLQQVFNRCYGVGPYRKRIDYRRDKPDVPLDRRRNAWAKSLVRPAK